MSDPFRQREVELLLLWPRERRSGGQGMTQRAQDPQAALDPIWADGIGNSQEIATRIMSFVSFHGAILKQWVGHGLSDG
jgi:ABC-type antimicrobial peptide transport system ATPase subunit